MHVFLEGGKVLGEVPHGAMLAIITVLRSRRCTGMLYDIGSLCSPSETFWCTISTPTVSDVITQLSPIGHVLLVSRLLMSLNVWLSVTVSIVT